MKPSYQNARILFFATFGVVVRIATRLFGQRALCTVTHSVVSRFC